MRAQSTLWLATCTPDSPPYSNGPCPGNKGPSHRDAARVRPLCLGFDELRIQRVGKPRHDFVLHVEKIGYSLVKAFSPKLVAGFGVDQLHVYPKTVVDALHRTFEPIANVQLPPNLPHIARLSPIGERGTAGDDKRAGNTRQVGGQALGHTIDKIILPRIFADIHERKDHNGKPRR